MTILSPETASAADISTRERAPAVMFQKRDYPSSTRCKIQADRVELADAVAAERIASGEAAAVRAELDALRKRRRRWFRW